MHKIRYRPLHSSILITAVVLSLTAIFVLIGGAQSRSSGGASGGNADVLYDPAGGAIIFPRVQIIQWQNTAGRFDSSTGEIKRFHGDLRDPQVRPAWAPDVPAVRERTSGMLRLQHPIGVDALDAPFLVDVVTGQTWLLQRRATGATWERVESVR